MVFEEVAVQVAYHIHLKSIRRWRDCLLHDKLLIFIPLILRESLPIHDDWCWGLSTGQPERAGKERDSFLTENIYRRYCMRGRGQLVNTVIQRNCPLVRLYKHYLYSVCLFHPSLISPADRNNCILTNKCIHRDKGAFLIASFKDDINKYLCDEVTSQLGSHQRNFPVSWLEELLGEHCWALVFACYCRMKGLYILLK